jgi:poly-gamma-glutamate system protein
MKNWFQKARENTVVNLSRTTDSSQKRFPIVTKGKLLLLAVAMAGLWYLAAPAVLSTEERVLWKKVHAAQQHLSQWREHKGTAASDESDPWNCGLIGVEWSGITTTLGDLSSKRTSCNPAWAVQFSRWFEELGLKPGDHIAIYSSGSFPALLLGSIAAAEAMELKPLLIVSLGSSTWGANHPDNPWPVLAAELRRSGFIRQRANYYTLGGDGELGHGFSPEGEALLRTAANDAGVELLMTGNLEEMIAVKSELLERHQARLLVSIGGSHANLGDALEILRLRTGLVSSDDAEFAGNGVIGTAMRKGIPVLHMLNIRSVSSKVGIPYDSQPRELAPARVSKWWSVVGVILFFAVVLRHRRWRLESSEE